MKLAILILPLRTNDNKTLHLEHQLLRSMLVSRWGGFTATQATGGWLNVEQRVVQTEQVWKYEIAMPRADVIHLRELAAKIGRAAQQQEVMIVTPAGDVEFVKPENYSA